MKNSINNIENQLNKIFESLDSKWIKTSFILSKLDLPNILRYQSKKSPFTPESFLKLYLYRRIKVIKRYPDILKQLQKDEQQAYDLGFYKDQNNKLFLPKKRTYNQFIHDYINKEIKEVLGIIAERIISIATKHKIVLDLEIIKKKIKENNDNYRKKLKEATQLIKKLVYPQIDIKIKENGKFTTKDLLDVLVHIAQTHDFCNNGSLTFKELNNKESPHGNTLLYHSL